MATSVTVYSSLRTMTHLWPVCWWWLPLWLYTPPWGQWLTYDLSVGDGHLCDCILLHEDNDSPMTCLLVMATSVAVYSSLRAMTHLWPVCWWWFSLWLYTPPWWQWLTYDLSVGDGHLCDSIHLLEVHGPPRLDLQFRAGTRVPVKHWVLVPIHGLSRPWVAAVGARLPCLLVQGDVGFCSIWNKWDTTSVIWIVSRNCGCLVIWLC